MSWHTWNPGEWKQTVEKARKFETEKTAWGQERRRRKERMAVVAKQQWVEGKDDMTLKGSREAQQAQLEEEADVEMKERSVRESEEWQDMTLRMHLF